MYISPMSDLDHINHKIIFFDSMDYAVLPLANSVNSECLETCGTGHWAATP